MNSLMRFGLPKFPVESESLKTWCAANVPGYVDCVSDDTSLKVITSSALTLDQQAPIKSHLASLTHDGEATKLQAPHCLMGAAKASFENSVKTVIAGKTWDTLTPAQRTFSMGGSLSASDYDSLPTS